MHSSSCSMRLTPLDDWDTEPLDDKPPIKDKKPVQLGDVFDEGEDLTYPEILYRILNGDKE